MQLAERIIGTSLEDDTRRRGEHDRQRDRPPAGARVTRRTPEVPRDRLRPAELLAAAADPYVEPVREHEVGEPERDTEHEDDAMMSRFDVVG